MNNIKKQDFILLPHPRKIQGPETSTFASIESSADIVETIDRSVVRHTEGYVLDITLQKAEIWAHDKAGLFYARQTLKQLQKQSPSGKLPVLRIEDWPDYPNRGVLLDISRDKVPTMNTLFELIDILASWKINRLQFYNEHVFAYKNHREVWAASSPLTSEEVRRLDSFCRERFIELVPYQNSFGHMHRWLKHDRYRPLSECPEGWPSHWAMCDDEPFSLCPTDERSLELLNGLYKELLPNFSSKYLMVGCDETFDIGEGRSKAYAEKIGGRGRLYLEFLNKLNELVNGFDKTMMFYSDIIINFPALLDELPRNAILFHWGYGRDFPFDEHCSLLSRSGLPFYVMSSNSAYSSIAGRSDRAMGNIENAALNGLKHGAVGMYNSDWGDTGHWHPLSISLPGFCYGAAMSWNAEGNRNADVAAALDRFVFMDKAGVVGKTLYELGNCYLRTKGDDDASRLYMIFRNAKSSRKEEPFVNLSLADLWDTLSDIDKAMSRLSEADMPDYCAGIVKAEIDYAADMLRFSCRAGIKLLESDAEHFSGIEKTVKADLREELLGLMTLHRQNWLTRNRIGGLEDSLWWYCFILNQLL